MLRIAHSPRIFSIITMLSVLCVFSSEVSAQRPDRAPWDGTMLSGEKCDLGHTRFGPFDYLQRDRFTPQLNVVEDSHFDEGVESLTRGLSATPMGDIHYTIMAWPNHHRALNSAVRFRLQHKELWHGGNYTAQNYPAECYLQRAIKFSPNDPIPYMLLGKLMHQMEQYDAALKSYREAVRLRPDDLITQYNMGLTLVELKKYREAQEVADKVYAAGFPLPGLKRKLDEAKRLKVKAPVTQAKAAAPALPDSVEPAMAPEASMPLDGKALPTDPTPVATKTEINPALKEQQPSESAPAQNPALEETPPDDDTVTVKQQTPAQSQSTTPPQMTPEQLSVLQQALKDQAAKKQQSQDTATP